MSWLLSILVGILTAFAGAALAGLIASAAVSWYRISSFEGGSGYFVLAMIILGLLAGLVIGLIGARMVAAGPNPGFIKALATCLGVVVGIGAVIGGVARLLADVPPTVGGQPLHVAVEVRWPEGQSVPSADSVRARVVLGSIGMTRVLRDASEGPLWLEDVRLEDGRRVVPGAVELFTERGKRVLDIQLGDSSMAGFLLPIPRRPGRKSFEWSPWYPAPPSGSAEWPVDKFSIRYRIQPRNEPVRVERVGDFEIATIASGFMRDEHGAMAASARFDIRYRGQALDFDADSGPSSPDRAGRAEAVGVVAGEVPALMVVASDRSNAGQCYLVSAAGESARIERVGECGYAADADLLTADSARFHAHRSRVTVRGTIDRVTYREPGLYQVGQAVVDTRHLTIRPLPAFPEDITELSYLKPLSLSPDQRSLVRIIYQGHLASTPALLVVDVVSGTTTVLPIDRGRMRYGEPTDLDPAWVDHHFHWVRRDDGADHLERRERFTPLPYRGQLSTSHDGGYYYTLKPAGQPLADAVVAFLVSDLGGTVVPRGEYITWDKVRIGERTVSIMATGSSADGYVMVSLETGEKDPELIPEVARRFDQALASGKYDSLFRASEP